MELHIPSSHTHTHTQSLDVEWWTVGFLVDKDNLINYQLVICYHLLIGQNLYQPKTTVDKTIVFPSTGPFSDGKIPLDGKTDHYQGALDGQSTLGKRVQHLRPVRLK